MQQRHIDRYSYFNELAITSRDFYIDYLEKFVAIKRGMNILEIGCGEGGNLLPFAEKECNVTGIDRSEERISQAISYFKLLGFNGRFIYSDFFDFSSEEDIETLLRNAIDKLPERCRLIFIKSRIEGKKYKEIAEELNLSVNTVEGQISIALKKLREELKDYLPLLLFLFIC